MIARTKLFSILGLTLALAGASAFAGDNKDGKAAKGVKAGDTAPAWTATDINGKEWKSTDFAGKIVVLEWVNPKCPVCEGAHKDGRIPNMVKELKGMPEVAFIAINSSHFTTAEQNKEALKAYGVEYPVLLDTNGTIGNAFGAKTTPHIYVMDTTGKVRYQGAIDNNGKKDKEAKDIVNYPLQAVKQIKANETVTPDYVKPYGCSVKFKDKEGDKEGKDKGDKH